jgi:hypothetical protein
MAPIEVDNCEKMELWHWLPYNNFMEACDRHMQECAACRTKYAPYYSAIDTMYSESINALSNAKDSFRVLAMECGNNGNPGSAGTLALYAVEQIEIEHKLYMEQFPDINLSALLWLQKVFVVCRYFEAQTRSERAIPIDEKSLRVGEMQTPHGMDKFADITSLSFLMEHHDKYSTFQYNRDLQNMIHELLKGKEYYRALRLICDSPKHGVLSSILNGLAVLKAKQVYMIGLNALAIAMNNFIQEYPGI